MALAAGSLCIPPKDTAAQALPQVFLVFLVKCPGHTWLESPLAAAHINTESVNASRRVQVMRAGGLGLETHPKMALSINYGPSAILGARAHGQGCWTMSQ